MTSAAYTEKPNWLIAKIAMLIWVVDILIVGVIPGALLDDIALSSFNVLILTQLAACVFLIVIVSIAGLWRSIGFIRPRGLMWLAWTSPFWLYAVSSVFAPQAAGVASFFQLTLFIGLAAMVGFSEETIYRGALWEMMRPAGVWPTVLTTSILFGGVHLVSLFWGAPLIVALSRSFFAFGAGLIFAAARLRSGSVLAPIVLHVVFDAIAFAIFGTAIFETQDGYDQDELFSAMLSFAITPGIVFGFWGAFAVERIRGGFKNGKYEL